MAETDDPTQTASPAVYPEPPVITLTTEDILRFIQGKWSASGCEICNTNKWHFDSVNKYVALPVSDGSRFGTVTPLIKAFLPVWCENCGNTKFILLPIIVQWLELNK